MWSRALQKTSFKNSIAFKMFEAIESQLFDSTKSIHEKLIWALFLIACGGFLKPTNLHFFIFSVRLLISCKSFDEQFQSISIAFYRSICGFMVCSRILVFVRTYLISSSILCSVCRISYPPKKFSKPKRFEYFSHSQTRSHQFCYLKHFLAHSSANFIHCIC